MGFPWVNGSDDWDIIGNSLDIYFSKLNRDGCCLVFDNEEIFIFTYNDMKFPNEDNWED